MLLVRVGLDDRRFHFAADFGRVADRHIVLDRRMFDDARVASQVGRAGEVGERSDAGMALQHDRTDLRVGHDMRRRAWRLRRRTRRPPLPRMRLS